jgi:ribosome-binding protein aMBF1 (putative translation factor)
MPMAAAPEAAYSLAGNCPAAADGRASEGKRMDREGNSFGERLRWWRARRGLSQLALAANAATTQRHLSFLESGRTAPSRTMVLRLADALDLPLRQ